MPFFQVCFPLYFACILIIDRIAFPFFRSSLQVMSLLPSLEDLYLETDCFHHPIAVHVLDWLPHALWHYMVHVPRGVAVLENLIAAVPASATTATRCAYLMR